MQRAIFWGNVPLVRLVIPLAIGVILGIEMPWRLGGIFGIVGVLAGVVMLLVFARKWKTRLSGLIISVVMLQLGYGAAVSSNHFLNKQHLVWHRSESKPALLLTVDEPLVRKQRSYKTVGTLQYILEEGELSEVRGRILLYLDTLTALGIQPGDQLVAVGWIQATKPPQNPNEFDYQRYLRFHQIAHQMYLPTGQFKVLHKDADDLVHHAMRLQHTLSQRFRSLGITGDNLDVLTALVLGARQSLDPEVKQDFSSAGAMHVLAVSGLHVGLLFLMVQFLTKMLGESKSARWLRFMIILLTLWAYAFITGLSPSVLRASTMFSILALSATINRRANVYNSLAGSALILLVVNPYIIMEVGFQLSYCAVIAIVTLYDRVYQMIECKYWILDKVWSLTVLSFTAQLGTFPIALLYFHQFPNLFLASNLAVIPLASIILISGLSALALSFVESIQGMLDWLLNALLDALNGFVAWVDAIPYALVTYIRFTTIEAIALSLAMVLLAIWLLLSKHRALVYSLIIIAVLSCYSFWLEIRHHDQREIVFYRSRKGAMFEVVEGRSHLTFMDTSIIDQRKNWLFLMQNNWIAHGLKESEVIPYHHIHGQVSSGALHFKNGVAMLGNKRFLFLHPAHPMVVESQRFDVVVLSGYKWLPREYAGVIAKSPLVVIDATNHFYGKLESQNGQKIVDLRSDAGFNMMY